MKEIWTTPIRTSTSNGTGQVYNPYVIDTPELWDNIFASTPTGSIIHLGMGEYKTYGFALNDLVPGQVEFKTGWNIIGVGRDKTIVKLIPAPSLPRYQDCGHSIFGTYYNTPLNNVVIDGMTLDLDMASQSGSRSFNGVQFCYAKNSVLKNIRVIRWGTAGSIEAFPLCIFRGNYIPSIRSSNNIIDNCIVERPVKVKSILSPGGGGFTAMQLVGDNCIIRDCIVDGRPDSGSFKTSESGNGICTWGINSSMHDNVIRYVGIGGPYHDTGEANDCIAYDNIYEFVLIACYQNYEGGATSGKIIFKNNYIELGKTVDYPYPVRFAGTWGNFDTGSAYAGQSLDVIGNVVKLHPAYKEIQGGEAFFCSGVKNVRVSDNILYLQPNYKPFTTKHCGQVFYSNNFNYKPKV